MEFVNGRTLKEVLAAEGRLHAPPGAGDRRRDLRRARVQPPARHHPPRHQAGQRHAHPDRPGQGDGLRHRPGPGQRRVDDDPDLGRDRHRAVPLARSRPAARPSTPAPTCTPPAACSSSCSAGTRRSSATARSASPTSTSGRTPKAPSLTQPRTSPPAVDAIVLKALAKNPLNRYQSAGEMRADLLRAAAGRPVYAEPVHAARRTAMTAAGRRPAPGGQRDRRPARVGDAAAPPYLRLGDRRADRARRAGRGRAGGRADRVPAAEPGRRCPTWSARPRRRPTSALRGPQAGARVPAASTARRARRTWSPRRTWPPGRRWTRAPGRATSLRSAQARSTVPAGARTRTSRRPPTR